MNMNKYWQSKLLHLSGNECIFFVFLKVKPKFLYIPKVKIHLLCEKIERNPQEILSAPVLHFQKSTNFGESDKQNDREYGGPEAENIYGHRLQNTEKNYVRFRK